jgi:hypothetical protein
MRQIQDLALQLLPVVLDQEVDVRIYSQGMVMCRLTGTVPIVSDMHRGRRAATVKRSPHQGRLKSVDLSVPGG